MSGCYRISVVNDRKREDLYPFAITWTCDDDFAGDIRLVKYCPRCRFVRAWLAEQGLDFNPFEEQQLMEQAGGWDAYIAKWRSASDAAWDARP
jgi:hypothetical protein